MPIETEFVEKCRELDGKELTYENLLSLDGYIGLAERKYNGDYPLSGTSGHYEFKKEYLDEFLNGKYLVNDGKPTIFKNNKLIIISPTDGGFSIADSKDVENIWSCRIIPDDEKLYMSTEAKWYPRD